MERWALLCYNWLLLAYPAEFRGEYGSAMRRDFAERYRERRGWRLWFWLETVADIVTTAAKERYDVTISDLEQSFRRQRMQPGVTAAAVLSLALGIGASSTVFSELYAAILLPLPYKDADRLVVVSTTDTESRNRSQRAPVSAADFIDWRLASEMLRDWHLLSPINPITITTNGLPEAVNCQHVTAGLFDALGVQPVIGRLFQPGEEAARPIIISESYWRRRFGGGSGVIGQTIIPGNSSAAQTIIGVLPATASVELFGSAREIDYWSVIDLSPGSNWIQRELPWLRAIARLKPGVSVEQAETEMTSVAARLERTYPTSNRRRGTLVTPLVEVRNGSFANVILPVFGAVTLVLLIACSNVANLLLARATARRREVALRAALGASTQRLVSEFLADGVVLAVPGAVFGLALAQAGIIAFRALAPEGFPGARHVELNLPVLLFTVTAGVLAALLSAIVPAIKGSRTDLTEPLKEAARGSSGRGRQQIRSLLVGAQIALAMILLIGAGLLIHTVLRLQKFPLGFDAHNVTVAALDISGSRFFKSAPKRGIDMRFVEPATARFYEHMIEKAKQLPGVEQAGLAGAVPMTVSSGRSYRIRIAGRDAVNDRSSSMWSPVTPGFFDALRITVSRGRAIREYDVATSPWVAVVNEAFVREFFPNRDAIGQYVSLIGSPEERPREIVGVIPNHTQLAPQVPVVSELYTSSFQMPREIAGNFQLNVLQPKLVLRISAPVTTEAIQKIVADFDPKLAVFNVRPLDEHISLRGSALRFYTDVLSLFAAIALVLASIGICGLMSYSITDRSREIGIRRALGASATGVIRLIAAEGFKLSLAGLAAGVAGGLLAAQFLAVSTEIAAHGAIGPQGRVETGLLFAVSPTDPTTYCAVGLLLFTVCMAACLIPASRATRVDPASALRRD